MNWDLSCPDWVERLQVGRSLVPDLPELDLVAGNRAVAVFNKLRLADVPGTPTMEEAGGDWFRDIVRAMFGSVDRATRRRMIRELFCLVPKKNSKTTDGALLMLVALLLNERPRANFIMTAPVQDVAEIAFSAVSGAIGLDPVLDKKFHVRDHLKTIIHRETKAELQIMTFDPAVLTGQKVSGGALIDELHQVAKMAKASKALRQLRGGMLPYPEAFLAFITTQSDEAPVGVFDVELTKARAIRSGQRQGAMLPVLYEFSEACQKDDIFWRNPANWPMVTPNLGHSITLERLIEGYQDAEASTDPGELRAWASQHLNVQIGLALHSDRWAGALFWEGQGDPELTLASLLERCEVVEAGVDGGGLDDMLALNVTGREIGTGNWLHWVHAWIHPVALERRKKENARYMDFVADGDLTIVETAGQDLRELKAFVQQCEDSGLLDLIGVDQAGIEPVVNALLEIEGIDLESKRIVGISQGWKMVGAIISLERRLADGTFWHGDTRLMAWCCGNAKPEPVGNAVKITKQTAGSAKIDPLMATLNSVTLLSRNPESRRKRYEIAFV